MTRRDALASKPRCHDGGMETGARRRGAAPRPGLQLSVVADRPRGAAARPLAARAAAAAREDGSVTIVIVGVIAALVLLAGCLATYAATAVATERARLAADEAALAGASVLLGSAMAPVSSPCALAQTTAQRNGARVVACDVRATSVQVEVVAPAPLGRQAHGVARAGSPEGAGQ